MYAEKVKLPGMLLAMQLRKDGVQKEKLLLSQLEEGMSSYIIHSREIFQRVLRERPHAVGVHLLVLLP